MTFLNPAILIGLLAAGIPILIHLLNLRKVERVEFSTLAFLKELQKSKIRKIKFKQWLLLILRILIIVSLVLAFSRPALKTKSLSNSSSSVKATAVIILDDTPSMKLLGENGSNFSLMKNKAEEILNNYSEGDRIFIIKMSDASLQRFTQLRKARKFIQNLSLSDLQGNLFLALQKAREVFKKSTEINNELFLISDFQKNLFNSHRTSNSPERFVPHVYWLRLALPTVNNFSLSNFRLENKILQAGKTISFTATVGFWGKNPNFSTLLSLFLNGKKEAQFSIKKGASQDVSLKVTLLKAGLISAEASLSDDSFEYDNRNYLCFNVPRSIDVAIIKERGADVNFLRLALNSLEGKFVNTQEFFSEQFNSINLRKFNAVVFVGVSSSLNTSKVKGFLSNGGGVILIPSKNSTTQKLNSFLRGLKLPTFDALIKTNNFENINSFGKTDFTHPLFEGLFASGQKPKIESPVFYGYFKYKTNGEGRDIIDLNDGSAFLSEYLQGRGRLLVFNTPFNLDFSDFPLKGFFAPLVNRSLFYLSSNVASIKTVEAGTPIEVNLNELTVPQLTVVKPNGEREVIDLQNFKGNYYKYSKTDKVGIYKFFSEKKLIDFAAVNPVKNESSLAAETEKKIVENLTSVFPNSLVKQIKTETNLTELICLSRFGVELWKYFLLLALLLALVEMLIAKSSKKDLVELESLKND